MPDNLTWNAPLGTRPNLTQEQLMINFREFKRIEYLKPRLLPSNIRLISMDEYDVMERGDMK